MTHKTRSGVELTDDMLDSMAREYEEGTWSGHGEISPGRPRLYDEDMETVSFRLPRSRIEAIEALAKRTGESKSAFFREAIDQALLAKA